GFYCKSAIQLQAWWLSIKISTGRPENPNNLIPVDIHWMSIRDPRTSSARPQSEFATIIWFHPGSFVTGTPAIWNPHTLVYRHRIIVVTVAYRLSVLGFFTTMDSEAPGNYALLDQQAAMHWVKKNIKLFGGNPDNICLMGYEAGATSIGLHMINSGSRNLFNKAIVMSGDFSSPSVYKSPQDYKREIEPLIPKHCEKTPTSKLIECMRHIDDPTWLIDQASQIDWRPMIVPATGNYSFLQDLPINYFERGEFNQIPFLTGYTDMEQVLEIGELTNITDFSSNKLKELLSKLVYDDITWFLDHITLMDRLKLKTEDVAAAASHVHLSALLEGIMVLLDILKHAPV
ncbi:hypothetical protein NQ317_015588, partial [Molorchus minor]